MIGMARWTEETHQRTGGFCFRNMFVFVCFVFVFVVCVCVCFCGFAVDVVVDFFTKVMHVPRPLIKNLRRSLQVLVFFYTNIKKNQVEPY